MPIEHSEQVVLQLYITYTNQPKPNAMPTRSQMTEKFHRDLLVSGLSPSDPVGEMLLQSLEAVNHSWADFDDEIAEVANQLKWLAAANWMNERPFVELEPFVEDALRSCEADLVKIRARWQAGKTKKPAS